MLKKDELKVLATLWRDLTKQWTIRGLSKELNQKYVQTYRTVASLSNSKNIRIESIGNSKIISLDFTNFNVQYTTVEIERLQTHLNNKVLRLVYKNIIHLHENMICVLFGSQVTKISPASDFDLLFVIPKQSDYSAFERKVKTQLSPYNCDINIVTEEGLIKMWSNPKKFNVGNEILKNHLILYGAEHFINLLQKYYVGP